MFVENTNKKNKQYESLGIHNNLDLTTMQDIDSINVINSMIEFLIKMNNSKLMYELYLLMYNQIKEYNKFQTTRVLELTKEQYNLFMEKGILLNRFTEEPFNVDSVVVCGYEKLKYKFFNYESEIDKFIAKFNAKHDEDKGFLFLTSKINGYLGEGLYTCNESDDISSCLFNNLIHDKLEVLWRKTDGYLYFAEGIYTGMIKKCVYGELEGIYVLTENLSELPKKQQEELSLYGELEVDYDVNTTVDSKDDFESKLMDSLAHLNVNVNVSTNEDENAMG